MNSELADALGYWKACCAIIGAHVFGLNWPETDLSPIRAPKGHWGANPGVAWIMAHLASHWLDKDPLQVLIGTGHATSFVLAHEAIRGAWPARRVADLIETYAIHRGYPSEILEWPIAIPQLFGELGSAIAVSQGVAAQSGHCTICIVGDGECETPVALAALIHANVLLGSRSASWLVAINANGARMGSRARFSASELERLLQSQGYAVFRSRRDKAGASAAARAALRSAGERRLTAWISETPKGWPAQANFPGGRFRGALAHKPPSSATSAQEAQSLMSGLIGQFAAESLKRDGTITAKAAEVASRATLSIQLSANTAGELPKRVTPTEKWRAPIEPVDHELARRRTLIFAPDEAASNRLDRCIASGLVTEVLAEEVCLGWAIGHIAAGQEAAFSSYEAFAPLISSQLAQYAKLIAAQDLRPRPPLALVITSLGWANSPTHQNDDLGSTFMNRGSTKFRLICPVGAASAAQRLSDAFVTTTGGAFALVCSKHPLLDLPDPGGPILRISTHDSSAPEALILACGDICVTEAIGAMTLAHAAGRRIAVLAIVEPTALGGILGNDLITPDIPLLASVWCSPHIMTGPLWSAFGRMFPVNGASLQYGPTPYEYLQLNGLDRCSLVRSLFPGIDSSLSSFEDTPHVVPHFVPPPLCVKSIT